MRFVTKAAVLLRNNPKVVDDTSGGDRDLRERESERVRESQRETERERESQRERETC